MKSNRASLRRSVRTFRNSSNSKATLICLLDAGLLLGALATTLLAPHLLVKLLAAVVMGLVISRLFVVAHDACHQALFTNRVVNRWVGRVLFLPSLTPYSLWEAGHNVSHHVYTNLKTHDFVWTPLSAEEYRALGPTRRALERFYRSGFGFWAYYGIEIWWRKMLFPNKREVPLRRPAFLRDGLLVCAFGAAWIAGLVYVALATGQSPWLLIVVGFLIPQFVWTLLMGAVIYFQHTNPTVAWFDQLDQWEATREGLSGTVLITFPKRFGRIINNIMEHPAHHLDVRIPLYQIEDAQEVLNGQQTGAPTQALTWRFFLDCVRRCKLYDYEAHRWTSFEGEFTSPCTLVGAATSPVEIGATP